MDKHILPEVLTFAYNVAVNSLGPILSVGYDYMEVTQTMANKILFLLFSIIANHFIRI